MLSAAGVSTELARRVHATLSAALSEAARDGLIAVNPCTRVRVPRADRYVPAVWSAGQAARFLHLSQPRPAGRVVAARAAARAAARGTARVAVARRRPRRRHPHRAHHPRPGRRPGGGRPAEERPLPARPAAGRRAPCEVLRPAWAADPAGRWTRCGGRWSTCSPTATVGPLHPAWVSRRFTESWTALGLPRDPVARPAPHLRLLGLAGRGIAEGGVGTAGPLLDRGHRRHLPHATGQPGPSRGTAGWPANSTTLPCPANRRRMNRWQRTGADGCAGWVTADSVQRWRVASLSTCSGTRRCARGRCGDEAASGTRRRGHRVRAQHLHRRVRTGHHDGAPADAGHHPRGGPGRAARRARTTPAEQNGRGRGRRTAVRHGSPGTTGGSRLPVGPPPVSTPLHPLRLVGPSRLPAQHQPHRPVAILRRAFVMERNPRCPFPSTAPTRCRSAAPRRTW